MSAYTTLPALLQRIESLESDDQLCRRRGCYSQAHRWLSPYCRPWCAPWGGGRQGEDDGFLFRERPQFADTYATRSLISAHLFARSQLAMSGSLRSFIQINTAC